MFDNLFGGDDTSDTESVDADRDEQNATRSPKSFEHRPENRIR